MVGNGQPSFTKESLDTSGGFREEAREAVPPLKMEERKCTYCF